MSPDWLVWATRLNQLSLIPFLGFLWTLWHIPRAPKGARHGFTFYLAFVAVGIPAGLYCRTVLGTSLANVDWLHGELGGWGSIMRLGRCSCCVALWVVLGGACQAGVGTWQHGTMNDARWQDQWHNQMKHCRISHVTSGAAQRQPLCFLSPCLHYTALHIHSPLQAPVRHC